MLITDVRALVTGGAQQGIALALGALLRPGDAAAIESPGYLGAIALCRQRKIPMVPVPVDRTGPNPGRLESAFKRHELGVLYTVPNYQNPTGVTQTTHRRRQLVELTARHRCLVIEDDTYGDLRLGGLTTSARCPV